MALVPTWLRPYVAGFVGTLATGFGHFYLRRWLRGLGWIALAAVVGYLTVPQQALDAVAAGDLSVMEAAERLRSFPAAMVQLVGALDAFILAYVADAGSGTPTGAERAAGAEQVAVAGQPEGGTVACPNCGKEVDADLGFCHWCTTEFVTPEGEH